MKQDTFRGFHPVVNLLYFVVMIGCSMFFMHPAFLAVSLFSACTYAIYLNGKRAVRVGFLFLLPMIIITAALNPLFNHQGVTILAYLPNGNPLTLESILFGVAAAVMLVTVMIWFSCFNKVMTSDKFVYLFGRIIPALSLILAMSLRLVPRFRAQIRVISAAQRGIGRDVSNGNLLQKARHGLKILSILVTWALENAIDTADSMKGRGYGLPGRTAFSIFRFDRRDGLATFHILICAAIVLIGAILGANQFHYFPIIQGQWGGISNIVVCFAYLVLGLFPIVVNVKEDFFWKHIVSNA